MSTTIERPTLKLATLDGKAVKREPAPPAREAWTWEHLMDRLADATRPIVAEMFERMEVQPTLGDSVAIWTAAWKIASASAKLGAMGILAERMDVEKDCAWPVEAPDQWADEYAGNVKGGA